jgi:hypothetical protein
MSEQNSQDLSGNGWVDRLLELEVVKREALLALDADSYETSSEEQVRLVASGVPNLEQVSRDRALALAEQTRLNSALLINLVSISPHFALAKQGYTSDGESSRSRLDRVQVEA